MLGHVVYIMYAKSAVTARCSNPILLGVYSVKPETRTLVLPMAIVAEPLLEAAIKGQGVHATFR